MNSLYKLMTRKYSNSSTQSTKYDGVITDVEDDEVNEDGFVIIKSEEKKKATNLQRENLQSNCFPEMCKKENLCSSSSYPKSQSSTSPISSRSTVLDVPMKVSKLYQLTQSSQTLSVNHRKFLDLDLFDYDFQLEISVLYH